MRIYNGKLSGDTVGGEIEMNLTNLNCLCHQLIVCPENETTVYSIQIISPDDRIIYERLSNTGTIAEITSIPLLGTYTFKIFSATSDETFFISVMARED